MISSKLSIKQQGYLLLFIAALAIVPFLGSTHLFDWDEINFAESSREMLVSGDFMKVSINYEPFREKPSLFFWLQSASMSVFGINEFAARLPNAIAGIVTLIFLMYAGKRRYNEKFGLLWALLYFASLLPQLYFRSGIIDPIFNLFIFISIFFIHEGLTLKLSKYFILAGIFSGLAVLSKGPVGLLITLISSIIFITLDKFRNFPKLINIFFFGLFFILFTFVWYGPETIKNGSWFLVEFIKYQVELFLTPVAGHGQPFLYHFYVILIGCFPISVLALPKLIKYNKTDSLSYSNLMLLLFWTVMIIFSISTTKIVHYSSMAYMPLSFLAALYLTELSDKKEIVNTWILKILLIIGSMITLSIFLLIIFGVNRLKFISRIKDEFIAGALQSGGDWNYKLLGIAFILGYGVILLYRNLKNGSVIEGTWMMVVSLSLSLSLSAIYILPKIESHSQGSAVNFFKSIAGKDVYVIPVGYKTYAHYFYAQISPENAVKKEDSENILREKTDKPVYVISKVSRGNLSDEYPQLRFLKSEGGFNFYMKE